MCSFPVKQCIILASLSFLVLQANCVTKEEEGTDPKNILFFMGIGSYSMRMSIWPLVEALAEKGHNVTFISAFENKTPHPAVHDYVPKRLSKWWSENNDEMNVYELRKYRMLIRYWFSLPQFGVDLCKQFYDDPEALKWVQNSKFRLVFLDNFYNDCALSLAHVFQAKTIVFDTTTIVPWFYDAFGIPDDGSWAGVDTAFGFPVRNLNFFHRTINAVLPVVWNLIREIWYFPQIEKITKDALKLDRVPSFSELERNTSLTFVTTHYSQEFARSFPPNVVPVGGLAITGKVKPAPKEMQAFIDKGMNGFIYISFGTMAEFSMLDKEVQEAFVSALLQFPHIQFIWKSAEGVGVELPENFMVVKWAPQQDLLAHPKIRTFITHAGLGGTNEAIYHGVPLIALPIFAEQDHNAYLLEAKKIGIKLEITTLKSEELQAAIGEITENSRFKQNMMKVSKLFKDRPHTPLETAVWWTEYVLRHEAADLAEFLRPLSVHQPWWVRRQLDVWLFVMLVVLLNVGVSIYILKWTICATVILFKYVQVFKTGSSTTTKVKKIKTKYM